MNVVILGDGLLGTELHVQEPGWKIYSRRLSNFDIDNIQLPDVDVIVNCIAHTDTYDINRNENWKVNYEFVADLVDYCNNNKIKLVQISTDYLYTNSKNLASELDVPVHCNNWYGYTKLLSDGYVQLKSADHLIIRCSHKKRPFQFKQAWIDQIGNFDYVDVIANSIIKLIQKDSNGIFNVGSELKTISDLDKTAEPVSKPDHVPSNISMDISKLKKVI
jgi:dTDP-4-dehydrorhamnose reductase